MVPLLKNAGMLDLNLERKKEKIKKKIGKEKERLWIPNIIVRLGILGKNTKLYPVANNRRLHDIQFSVAKVRPGT